MQDLYVDFVICFMYCLGYDFVFFCFFWCVQFGCVGIYVVFFVWVDVVGDYQVDVIVGVFGEVCCYVFEVLWFFFQVSVYGFYQGVVVQGGEVEV